MTLALDAAHADPARPESTAVPRPPSGLYIHVPFCVSICPYCDFVVFAGKATRGPEHRIDRFLAALGAELHLRADALDARWGAPASRGPLETLYLGGGTPSLLPAEVLSRLVGLVRERFGLAGDAEVTLEANPGPEERGDAGAIRAAGVTRLSIGAQSFDAAELRRIGRRHRAEDVAAAVAAARAAGIDSVSLDLLYDLPDQSMDTWARSVDAALALQPDHISAYALTLDDPDGEGLTGATGDHLPVRRGARQWRHRARQGQDDDRAAAMYEHVDARLGSAGLEWYEISSWSRRGHPSRHNLGYWQGRTWEAVGPGAHAFDGERRRWNAAPLDGYVRALLPADGTPPGLPPGGEEAAASTDGEAAMLALRTRHGLPATAIDRTSIGGGLRWALGAGLVETADDRLVLTRRGRLLSNEVFARIV